MTHPTPELTYVDIGGSLAWAMSAEIACTGAKTQTE
jgi:hypothetical protein